MIICLFCFIPYWDNETSTSTSPEVTSTEAIASVKHEEDPYANLSKEECEEKVELEGFLDIEPWYFYPQGSECYDLAIWQHFKMVRWSWMPEWFIPACDQIHGKFKQETFKKILKKLKAALCEHK